MTKPFSLEEVVARIRAILRRTREQVEDDPIIRVGDLEINEDSHDVTRAGQTIDLSPTEYKLLRYLMDNEGRVLSKAQILDHVWQYDWGGDAAIVESYISYLRKKVDDVTVTDEDGSTHKVTPVSYTHLDVYKRQVGDWRVDGTGGGAVGWEGEKKDMCHLLCLSVSYAVLFQLVSVMHGRAMGIRRDVYKRQIHRRELAMPPCRSVPDTIEELRCAARQHAFWRSTRRWPVPSNRRRRPPTVSICRERGRAWQWHTERHHEWMISPCLLYTSAPVHPTCGIRGRDRLQRHHTVAPDDQHP